MLLVVTIIRWMNDNEPLTKLELILLDAAKTALQWSGRRSELILDEKSVGQFASNADVEVENQINRDLSRAFGDVQVVGEETGGRLSADQSGWAIDPIDGTSNFLLGLPLWAISVGYLVKGRSTLGAIALPELSLILSAADGQGLRVNRLPVRDNTRTSSVKVIALGENDYESGSQTDLRADALRQNGYAVVRYRCAVFSLASAALGRLSGYIENGCGLWDVAAAEVICREAGMSVQTSNIANGRYYIDAQWPD